MVNTLHSTKMNVRQDVIFYLQLYSRILYDLARTYIFEKERVYQISLGYIKKRVVVEVCRDDSKFDHFEGNFDTRSRLMVTKYSRIVY